MVLVTGARYGEILSQRPTAEKVPPEFQQPQLFAKLQSVAVEVDGKEEIVQLDKEQGPVMLQRGGGQIFAYLTFVEPQWSGGGCARQDKCWSHMTSTEQNVMLHMVAKVNRRLKERSSRESALFLPLCLADTAVPVETASLLELDQRRSKRAVRREGDPVEEVRGSNASWSLHGTFRQSLVGASAYLLAESPQLELLLEETETKAPGDAVMEEKSWRAVYILTVLIFIAISPIGFNEGLKPFCTVVVYLACLSLVKMWVKETMNNGFPYPDTITAVHMLCTSLVAGFFERPRLSEAWVVLPISVVNGASLLSNNTAMLYGGVAFVSMVASCTPMFTFSLELLKGKRGETGLESDGGTRKRTEAE
ncbi:unnamed protein product [Effrenium voratum]|nr:unnamed protein product [Effrenium voratum]